MNISTPPKTANKLTIGIDCRMYSSHFTGIGRYVYELVKNLQEIDQRNDYFLFFNEPEFSNFIPKNPNFQKVLVNAKHYSISEQTTFLKILNRHKLDLMHFTHFNAPILYRRPSIVTIHDLTLHFFPGKKMASFFHRAAYALTIRNATRHAKKIIAVSRNTAKDLQEILHTPLKKVHVIYEGVAPEFQPLTDQTQIQTTLNKYAIKQPFLLYTGVWRDHKNIYGLLEAFSKLLPAHPDLQLIITGKTDNIYAQEVLSAIQKFKLENNLVLPGLVAEKELIELINAAYAYIFPSFYEGFGLPPLEAMQCATPAVVSNTSCLPEICGNAALYFNPYDPDDMAAQMDKILVNPELAADLIKKGLSHVRKFSWSKMAKETHQLYLQSHG